MTNKVVALGNEFPCFFKVLSGTLICVIPTADTLVVVADKRTINLSNGDFGEDVEKLIPLTSNTAFTITGIYNIDYGSKAPFLPYNVITEIKPIFQSLASNLVDNELNKISLELKKNLQKFLDQVSDKYWPVSPNGRSLFQIVLFECIGQLSMYLFTVYCDSTSGARVEHCKIESNSFKSSRLMAFGNTTVLANAKIHPQLVSFLSNDSFLKITDDEHLGFLSEDDGIAVGKFIISQSEKFWSLFPDNLPDIGTLVDVATLNCSDGFIWKEKNVSCSE